MSSFEIFQSRIKELREERGMTQKDFSEFIGISQQTLSGYERGVTTPSPDALRNIAEKCNISVDWLLGLSDKKYLTYKIETYSDLFGELIKLYDAKRFEIETMASNKVLNLTVLTFDDIVIPKFMEDWMNILALRYNRSVDDELYSIWLERTLAKYDIPIENDSN
ncbi:MAG TPA: helix-turn-helix transcriptional regulator [Clostridiales bacterium]|nr:helix-turn-helix transcriptional regulator [Clostridiales bacterium]